MQAVHKYLQAQESINDGRDTSQVRYVDLGNPGESTPGRVFLEIKGGRDPQSECNNAGYNDNVYAA